MIERYLRGTYRDGGRGPDEWDCWGLTRTARHELFGLPLLPSYGAIGADDKRRLTEACRREAQAFTPGPPEPAAIATVWKRGLCIHVALVVACDGRLGVLEAGKRIGIRWLTLADFERRYLNIVYYA